MPGISRRKSLAALAGLTAAAAASTGCVSGKQAQAALAKSTEFPYPVRVKQRVDDALGNFRAMLGPYFIAATGERTIPIEIDFIGNESGIDKELPSDLGDYVRNVIESIGGPFETYRTWAPIAMSSRPGGVALALAPNDRPRPPKPMYRLVGSLLHFSERLQQGGNGQIAGAGGGGATRFDAQATHEKRNTISALTVSLTLEAPNGVAIPGASAVYRINVEKNELNRSISIYVGGSGIGGGTKAIITQDSSDAIFDAMAYSVLHILGNALLAPYYRCSEGFAPDIALDARVRNVFNRATRSALDENIKRFLYLSGLPMDMQVRELTAADRAVVVLEMHGHGREYGDRAAMAEYAVNLWKSLDLHGSVEETVGAAGAKRTAADGVARAAGARSR